MCGEPLVLYYSGTFTCILGQIFMEGHCTLYNHAYLNFYNQFVSVFLVCVGRKWRRLRSSPWPLTNRLTTAPTSSVIGSFRSANSRFLLSVSIHYLSLPPSLSPSPPSLPLFHFSLIVINLSSVRERTFATYCTYMYSCIKSIIYYYTCTLGCMYSPAHVCVM